jgi:streptogramin lyase
MLKLRLLFALFLLSATPIACDGGSPVVGGGPPCAAGASTICGTVCVNLQTESRHCGTCGRACAANELCQAGACVLNCPAGQRQCGSACIDLQSDRAHCGTCDVACASGQVCSGGACQTSCAMGTTSCSGSCRDLQTDRANCGACGTACAAGQVCSAGSCQVSCGAGTTTCTGVCRDLQTDRANCGACGTACSAGQVCSAGMCQVSCGASLSDCGGSCRDLQSDRANCGACGTQCSAGQVCTAGSCQVTCVAGTTNCEGVCRDLQSDRLHCGTCGAACPAGQVCTAGMCQVSCVTGLTNCDGTCRDLQSDRANCGACGTACPAGQVCTSGACAASCASDQTVCAGACTNTQFDPRNCGACGTTCGPFANAAASCNAGACVQTCAAGFADCDANTADGCERNLASDLSHCGRCGNACPARANAASVCNAGACGFVCMQGFADCDGNPTNGCEVNLATNAAHCGMCGNACSPANGTGRCEASACAVASCGTNFADCDRNPANGCEQDTRLTCGGCDLTCRDRTVGGTAGNPFQGMGQQGTAVDPMRGGLVVSGMSTTTVSDFLWVVNTAESTMSKWDATGQREIARYRVGLSTGECRGLCCFNNGCNMPSRVVVDGAGDAYVASRGFVAQGTVTKIAAERTSCVDRNNNGMIDTSTGASNVLAYGADECVLWTAPVGPVDAVLRAIATDRGDTMNPGGYVWVGGYNNRGVYRLNPRTGAVLNTFTSTVNPYGMLVTGNGTLWVTSIDSAAMQPFDTTALTAGTAVPYPLALRGNCRNAYGLTADGAGRVWLAGWDCRDAIGYNPATNQWTRVDLPGIIGGTAGRGITVDGTGRVWLTYATSSDGPSGGLLSWDSNAFVPNGNISATAVTRVSLPGNFTGPSALGVDRVGNIWLAHYQSPSPLIRYTPTTNAAVVLFGPNQTYSYSDFTGSVRRTSIAQGTYEETIDLGCDNPTLTTFTWAATTPAGTSITFSARTAANTVGLGGATNVTVALAPRDTSPVSLATAFTNAAVTPARQLRLSINMQSSEGGATPVLQSFNVGWRCPR